MRGVPDAGLVCRSHAPTLCLVKCGRGHTLSYIFLGFFGCYHLSVGTRSSIVSFLFSVGAFLLSSCAGQATVDLTVKLRTDYQPLREFLSAEVIVDADPQDLIAEVDGQYVRPGVELARFEGLAPNEKRAIKVTLKRLGGKELISTTVLIEHLKDTVITIAITRDCSNVTCGEKNGIAQRCLSGLCMDARCIKGDEPYCSELLSRCNSDGDCKPAAPCAKATCEAGICFSDAQNSLCAMDEVCDIDEATCVPASTPGECMADAACTDGMGSDGCIIGQCLVEVEACLYTLAPDGQTCATDGMCQKGICMVPADSCTNGVLDTGEMAIDCGGGCPGCPDGTMCLVPDDCASGVCDDKGSNTCEAADTCGNGLIETGESCDDGDIVVGDGCDASCLIEDGYNCAMPSDCAGGSCILGVCQTPPAHCTDTVLSGDETDVDCGGSCGGCAGGQMCNDGGDCLGFSCLANLCEPAHCGDGMMSGDELGADCGGSCGTACVVYDCAGQTQIPLAECEKLKDYYNAADGPNWATITNWFSDNMPCTWTGITCSAIPGNISELAILETNQHGVIARGMDTLSELTYLEIEATTCCTLRTELFGPIPAEIGNLAKLTQLRLGYNQLTGSIPVELGALTNLTGLSLYSNQLTGTIPVELGALTNLTGLRLYSNQLTGSIPVELGALTNLTRLYLYSNQLTGSIPIELGALTNLTWLRLDINQLTGTIPVELGALTNLTQLYLYSNQLTGTIPVELGALTNLTQLYLHNNQLTGTIPVELGALMNLTLLRLYSNQLTGTIPVELGALTNLTWLRLDSNQLTGTIPVELGALTNLTSLYLYSNQLTGSIPVELGALTNLTWLRLDINQLTGTIPVELGALTNLTQLYLYSNQLTGTIPVELGALTNLTGLYLYNNQLTGTIPVELGALTNLTQLLLYDNQLTGSIPTQITNLSALNYLDICPQLGTLTSDMATGNWLRMVATTDWPAGDAC